ncbi:hypothetical protein JMJ56_22075 [Belnapia sp. T18]|uniref:Uncharacterized protein n=1 Tax=Belnapia arida TaxID=2804533 RepID=A0ABS1U7Q9_9PROT|nr:hypothetical protein [Belnapia arida]MBL6080708.1 hypothetical protein [Belnapia arida]
MTDFVIVVAAVASLAASPNLPPEAAIPQNAPTIGFRLYKDLHACEAATAQLTPRRGMRHVCVPVESGDGELASAY